MSKSPSNNVEALNVKLLYKGTLDQIREEEEEELKSVDILPSTYDDVEALNVKLLYKGTLDQMRGSSQDEHHSKQSKRMDKETRTLIDKIRSLARRIHFLERKAKKHRRMVEEAERESIESTVGLMIHKPKNDSETGFDEDSFTLMMTSTFRNKAWWYGLAVWLLQITFCTLIFIEITTSTGTPFGVPFMVDETFRVTQFIAMFLSVSMSTDVIVPIKDMTILWITQRESWVHVISFQTDGNVFLPTSKDWVFRVVFPNFLKFTEGSLVLVLSFIIIIQSDNIVDLFIDLTVMQIISDLDNVAFWLADQSYIGTNLKRCAVKAKRLRVKDEVPKIFGLKRLPLRPILLVTLVILMTGGLVSFVLRQNSGEFFRMAFPDCNIQTDKIIFAGDGLCHGALNILQCGFDAGDCLAFNQAYPFCDVPEPFRVGDGKCDDVNNKQDCAYDGGDCCAVKDDPHLGDGICHGGWFNTKACKYDQGDCNSFLEKYPDCPEYGVDIATTATSIVDLFELGDGKCALVAHYMVEECGHEDGDCKDCIVDNPKLLGNNLCDGGMYNTEGCMNDNHDCDMCNSLVKDISLIGNNFCDGGDYMSNEECNNDGGDCADCNAEDPFLIKNGFCEGGHYMSDGCSKDGGDCAFCNVDNPFLINDNFCNGGQYISEGCDNDGGDCDDCVVPDRSLLGNGLCNGGEYNNEECGWDGGDCLECNQIIGDDEISNLGNGVCDLNYGGKQLNPSCNYDGGDCSGCDVTWPSFLGNGICNFGSYDTKECKFDNGDCLSFNYPDCIVLTPSKVADGRCDGRPYNSEECGYDAGDCLEFNANYPYCDVPEPWRVGNGICDEAPYNDYNCGYDGGDCIERNDNMQAKYPNCSVVPPNLGYSLVGYLGDNLCHGQFNNEDCGHDDNKCHEFNAKYKNCKGLVTNPHQVGDGTCNHDPYNVEACEWDGGDCLERNEKIKLMYPSCTFLDDAILNPQIGNGLCQSKFNIEECGWDGGDCDEYNLKYPDCKSTIPTSVGDGFCDDLLQNGMADNNVKGCDWDGGDCNDYNDEARKVYPSVYEKYPDCPPHKFYGSWINDTLCDYLFNTEECGWDGGDCEYSNQLFLQYFPNCTAVQYWPWYGDGVCGEILNNPECNFDGGDCN